MKLAPLLMERLGQHDVKNAARVDYHDAVAYHHPLKFELHFYLTASKLIDQLKRLVLNSMLYVKAYGLMKGKKKVKVFTGCVAPPGGTILKIKIRLFSFYVKL